MTAIRLTFDIADGKPIFKSSMRVNMRIPPQQKISNLGSGSGLWLELRDPKGNILIVELSTPILLSLTPKSALALQTGHLSDVRFPEQRV